MVIRKVYDRIMNIQKKEETISRIKKLGDKRERMKNSFEETEERYRTERRGRRRREDGGK